MRGASHAWCGVEVLGEEACLPLQSGIPGQAEECKHQPLLLVIVPPPHLQHSRTTCSVNLPNCYKSTHNHFCLHSQLWGTWIFPSKQSISSEFPGDTAGFCYHLQTDTVQGSRGVGCAPPGWEHVPGASLQHSQSCPLACTVSVLFTTMSST